MSVTPGCKLLGRVRASSPNGAICSMSGDESECSYGTCSGIKTPSTSSTKINPYPSSGDGLKIGQPTKSVDFSVDDAFDGNRHNNFIAVMFAGGFGVVMPLVFL